VTWWLAAHVNIYKQHINRFDIHNTITLTTPHDSPKMGPPKQMYPPLNQRFPGYPDQNSPNCDKMRWIKKTSWTSWKHTWHHIHHQSVWV
jgi:hypothetical protein